MDYKRQKNKLPTLPLGRIVTGIKNEDRLVFSLWCPELGLGVGAFCFSCVFLH